MERTLDDELIDAFDVAVPERSAATTMKHSNNSVVQAMGAPRYPSLDSHESLQSPVVMGRPLLHSLSSSTYAPIYPSLNAEPMPTPVPAAVVGGPSDVVLPQVPAPALTASLPSDAPAIPTVPEELPRAIKRDNDKDAGNVSSNSTDSLEALAQDPAALAIAQEKLMDELLAYGARTAYVADALAGETPHQVQERARRAAERQQREEQRLAAMELRIQHQIERAQEREERRARIVTRHHQQASADDDEDNKHDDDAGIVNQSQEYQGHQDSGMDTTTTQSLHYADVEEASHTHGREVVH